MTTKLQKSHTYEGLGFPVVLEDVPVVHARGLSYPDVDFNKLQRDVFRSLAEKPGLLAGNELRFIRLYSETNASNFARRFGVTSTQLRRWESTGNEATGMSWSVEKDLRLFILAHLGIRPKEFAELYGKLEHAPRRRRMASSSVRPSRRARIARAD